MNKEYVLAEIRRTATENGDVPLGREAFGKETGIKQTDWYGKYWARWGDALVEAGFAPNQMQEAFADDHIIEHLISLIRELGHFPVHGEIRLKARSTTSFPSHTTFARLGSKRELVAKVIAYCESRTGYDDVVSICRLIVTSPERAVEEQGPEEELFGSVYLLRSGRYYKVGMTNAAGRRERELAIQLPEKAEIVHVIRTDDPSGIEAYWHKRFAAMRMNGEWFALTPADIKAFRRRRFM
jgi:hypothetical protein